MYNLKQQGENRKFRSPEVRKRQQQRRQRL